MSKFVQDRAVFWIFVVLVTLMAHTFVFAFWTVFPVTVVSASGYIFAVTLMIVSAMAVIKTTEPVHLLRWQFSTMVSGLLIQVGIVSLYRKPNELPFLWVLAIPMLLISAYSFVQSKQKNGGRQLDLPTNLVHSVSRLSWKWFTTPRLDFWVCWIGLLIPFSLSCLVFYFAIKSPFSDTVLTILRLGWIVSAGFFLYAWLRELFVKERAERVGNYAATNRNLGLAIVSVWLCREQGIMSALLDLGWIYLLTDMFMTAFKKSIDRQTSAGIGEYEALEGPSLGL